MTNSHIRMLTKRIEDIPGCISTLNSIFQIFGNPFAVRENNVRRMRFNHEVEQLKKGLVTEY